MVSHIRAYQNNKNTYQPGNASIATPRPPTYDPILCLNVNEKKNKIMPTIPPQEPLRGRASKVIRSNSNDVEKLNNTFPPPQKSEIPRLQLPKLNMNNNDPEPITRRISEPSAPSKSKPYRFDIIANQYLDYNDEIIIDKSLTARNTSAKYRKMKVYNPIINSYLSKDLEEEARRNETQIINKKNEYHQKLQPMSLKNRFIINLIFIFIIFSEGSMYNITSVDVAKNEYKLQEWCRNQELLRQRQIEQAKNSRQAIVFIIFANFENLFLGKSQTP